MRLLFLLIFSTTLLFSYIDSDIDGVEDIYDRCPNTPFDQMADEFGCSNKQEYKGELTISAGSDISWDKFLQKSTSNNLAIDYRYKRFDFSLSNTNYQDISDDSIYISGGYLLTQQNSKIKFTLGSKLSSTADDYYYMIGYNYFLNKNMDLQLHYGYTISGDTKEVDYEDFNSFSTGLGYAFDSRYYSSLSYEYSGSIYKDSEAYRAVSWFHSYEFSKKYFVSINYAKALDNLSYDNTLSLKFGVNFE